jgi:hypothetical protein
MEEARFSWSNRRQFGTEKESTEGGKVNHVFALLSMLNLIAAVCYGIRSLFVTLNPSQNAQMIVACICAFGFHFMSEKTKQ